MGYDVPHTKFADNSVLNCSVRKKSICSSGPAPFHYIDHVTLLVSIKTNIALEDLSVITVKICSSKLESSNAKYKMADMHH